MAIRQCMYVIVCALAALLVTSTAVAQDQYAPPSGYYNTATGIGLTLQSQLHDIIDNHITRSYDDAREALQILDEDPNNLANIILIYDGRSVVSTWDAGVTWNREHQWPRSRGVGESGPDNSDLFNLRSCTPAVNGARGNDPYGIGASFWDPKQSTVVNDRGDCSRAMFYMAVRYDGSDVNTVNLQLVNGFPSLANQMGDLSRMLEWHYTDPVDEKERRRNHLVWSSADNPLYYQGNRNPFVDHPEYVWAIWGTADNNSTVYVGDTVAGDGSSTAAVTFRTLVGAVPPSQFVALNKTGTTPTTYDVMVVGDVACDEVGTGRAFTTDAQSRALELTATNTSTVGTFVATVTIDNTDLTSAAAGQGNADANDTIDVTTEVLAHSEASFDDVADVNDLTIDFGTLAQETGIYDAAVSIYNLPSLAGDSAKLSVTGVSGAGHTSIITTDLAPFDELAAGDEATFAVHVNTDNSPGTFAATYTIAVADELLPGSQVGDPLTLHVAAQIGAFQSGDLNCDGELDLFDIDAFVLALTSATDTPPFASYAIVYPGCDPGVADIDGDGSVTNFDIDPFVALIIGG